MKAIEARQLRLRIQATKIVDCENGDQSVTTAQHYTGTLEFDSATAKSYIEWNYAPRWTVADMGDDLAIQTLTPFGNQLSATIAYSRMQGGHLLPAVSYIGKGLRIVEQPSGDEGTYDPVTGQIRVRNYRDRNSQ